MMAPSVGWPPPSVRPSTMDKKGRLPPRLNLRGPGAVCHFRVSQHLKYSLDSADMLMPKARVIFPLCPNPRGPYFLPPQVQLSLGVGGYYHSDATSEHHHWGKAILHILIFLMSKAYPFNFQST